MANTSSLAHSFTVSQVSVETSASTFMNIVKRRESILYRNTVPDSAANLAYVVSDPITPARNLSITDRSISLAANRVTSAVTKTESGIETFIISTENFLVTDKFTEATSTIATTPLFYKHVIDRNKLPRVSDESDVLAAGVKLLDVKILDSAFTDIGIEEKKVDLSRGILYLNLLSEYTDAINATWYYIQYTFDDNGTTRTYVELLNNEPVFLPATLDDLDPLTMTLLPTVNAYLVEEVPGGFEVTLPVAGTYAYKPSLQSRIQILPPTVEDTDDLWSVRVSNGKFFTNLDGVLHKYYIAEFLSQNFFPEPPKKQITTERSTVVTQDVIKLDRDNIVVDADNNLHLNILVNDRKNIGRAAFTTDLSKHGTIASNGTKWAYWSSSTNLGIRSIDKLTGLIDLEGFDLNETDIVRSSYTFTETQYEFTTINFNPVMNQPIIGQRVSLFVLPEVTGGTLTQTLYYVISDKAGKIIMSNWSRFNNGTQQLDDGYEIYYESFPSWLTSTSGLHKFVQEFTVEDSGNTDNFLILGDITVGEATSVHQLNYLDTRIRGGGIREDKLEQALVRDPDVKWFWDESNWDGLPYPGNAAYVVEVPVDLLEGAGGVFTAADIKDIVNRHTALGVYPITKAHGIDVVLSGIAPQPDGIYFEWSSRGYPLTTAYYNIYYSTTEDGPWTLDNPSPILHVASGHSYTITGLQLGVEYYLAVIGGTVDADTGDFLPYASQSLSSDAKGAASIGAGIEPQINFKTYAAHTIADSQALSHTFTVV